jgi:mRNA interferase RelE/StbE
MGSYSIVFKPSVEKDLRSLPKEVVARVLARIENLQSEPLPRQAVKLSGAERLYRIRVGEYRVIYEIDSDAMEIIVHYVRHRREAYRRL